MSTQRHDCGEHGALTVAEIAKRLDYTETAIYDRLRRGIRGIDLLAPRPRWVRGRERYPIDAHVPPDCHSNLFIACQIANEFKTAPSVIQLQQRFGMSRATAYRWRRTWLRVTEMVLSRRAA